MAEVIEATEAVTVPPVAVPVAIQGPEKWEEEARAMTVKSGKALEKAGDVLTTLAGLKKEVKKAFDDHVKAAHALHKGLTATRREYMAPLESAEMIIKKKMGAYRLAEEKKIREAQEKAAREAAEKEQAAMEAGEPAPPPPPPPPVKTPKQVDGVAFVEHWDFIIENVDLIPREFLVPDEMKIRRLVKAMRAETNIPGVKVTMEKRPRTVGR